MPLGVNRNEVTFVSPSKQERAEPLAKEQPNAFVIKAWDKAEGAQAAAGSEAAKDRGARVQAHGRMFCIDLLNTIHKLNASP
jgi:hypothetical protein